jgi:hypothetical protein
MGSIGAWGWLTGGATPAAPAPDPAPAGEPLPAAAGAIARRAALRSAAGIDPASLKMTRAEAMSLSVVNRARDLVVGVLSTLPFDRERTRAGRTERLGPGWLARPDPTRTPGAWIADIVDDLFFHANALGRVTARYAGTAAGDLDGYPAALQYVPWLEVTHDDDAGEWTWTPAKGAPVTIRDVDAVLFESPLTGVLEAPGALAIARRLDRSAFRFSSSTVPMGWLKQTGGEPLAPAEMTAFAQEFAAARDEDAIAFLNEWVEYSEASIDPSRLQLVEARAFQDAAVARVCNVPNYTVGVAVPGDSMSYKTSQSARLDLVDFTLAPFVACLEQTLSGPDVTPAGTTVRVDLEPFLRSGTWATEPQTAPTSSTPGGNQ